MDNWKLSSHAITPPLYCCSVHQAYTAVSFSREWNDSQDHWTPGYIWNLLNADKQTSVSAVIDIVVCLAQLISCLIHLFLLFTVTDKKAGKFKEWIDCPSLIDMKPNTPIMEVFSHLAYETVDQVNVSVSLSQGSWNMAASSLSKWLNFTLCFVPSCTLSQTTCVVLLWLTNCQPNLARYETPLSQLANFAGYQPVPRPCYPLSSCCWNHLQISTSILLLCCCSLQIVDLALLVKKDSERGDVLSSTMPVVSAVSQNQVSGLPNLTLPTSTASTPNHTPPGTPTTPTTSTAFMSSPSTSTASASAGSIAGVVQGKAAKGKKGKAKVPNETI